MKKAKRVFALVLALVMALSLLAGCGGSSGSGNESGSETKTIRVGTLPFTGSVPVAYALEKGYFEEAGLEVEQYEFATGAPMNEAFAAGQLDIAVIGLAGVISMSTGNAVCIYETNTASGGNGIFTRPDSPLAQVSGQCEGYPNLLGSADLLKGTTIIGNLGTASQLQTILYLEHFGLTQDDINFVNMDTGADDQAFKSGEGDAVSLMTPYTYNAADDGYIQICSFEDAADYVIPDTMLATKSFMESDRDTAKLFLEVYLKAVDELNADDELMFTTSRDYFAACGREYGDDYVKRDLETRFLIDKDYMAQDGYCFGSGMWEVAKLFTDSGKIEESNLHNVIDCLDTSLIQEITGLQVAIETGD